MCTCNKTAETKIREVIEGEQNARMGKPKKEWRPEDRLQAVPDPKNVSRWGIFTESDGIHIATVHCVVAEGFAKGLVETWNERMDREKAEEAPPQA